MTAERWVPVLGYEDLYEVSDMGNIRRKRGTKWAKSIRNLRPGRDGGGYELVRLCRHGSERTAKVSRVVVEGFTGVRLSSTVDVHHRNGIRHDNRLENLEALQESQHMKHHPGVGVRGEAHYRTSLTADDVARMRSLRSSGAKISDLAAMFKMTGAGISAICTGKNWKEKQAK